MKENASKVEVCVVLNGARAGTDIEIHFELIPDTANTCKCCFEVFIFACYFPAAGDYKISSNYFRIQDGQRRSCKDIEIENDNLVEGDEKFKIRLLPESLFPPQLKTNVMVNQTNSTVTIIDDDG